MQKVGCSGVTGVPSLGVPSLGAGSWALLHCRDVGRDHWGLSLLSANTAQPLACDLDSEPPPSHPSDRDAASTHTSPSASYSVLQSDEAVVRGVRRDLVAGHTICASLCLPTKIGRKRLGLKGPEDFRALSSLKHWSPGKFPSDESSNWVQVRLNPDTSRV